MVQVTPFLLVLCLALVAPGFSAGKCVLNGRWTNNLGHVLVIRPSNQPNSFNGSYLKDKRYHLQQTQIQTPRNFRFTVYWTSDKRTIFTGQYLVNPWGKEFLKTTCMLQLHLFNNHWETIGKGTCVFTRLHPYTEGGIVEDFNTDGSTWDADPLSCSTTGLHSQEKDDSEGLF